MNTCTDCGKEIGPTSTRCRTCYIENKILPNTCVDCGKEIKQESMRCKPCDGKNSRNSPNICIDCGKEISPQATYCQFCYTKNRIGKKVSEETRRKMSETTQKYWDKIERKEYVGRWGNDYEIWRKGVLEHDKYQCVHCGKKEKLQVHHIEDYGNNPELRVELSNGITLCKKCHKNFHHLYGRKSTRDKVLHFLRNIKI